MPELPITIFTDSVPTNDQLFDQQHTITEAVSDPFKGKLARMLEAPYDESIFLDTDTYVCKSILELFDLLEHFDIAMTHDRGYIDKFSSSVDVPPAFREFNSGVVAFRKTDAVRDLWLSALKYHDFLGERGEAPHDQPAIRVALYQSDIRIAPLSLEYNCRFVTFGHLNGTVKVLHGRPPLANYDEAAFQKIAAGLNRTSVPRVFVAGNVYALMRSTKRFTPPFFGKRVCSLFPSRGEYVIRKTSTLVREHGVAYLGKKLWRYIVR